MIGDHAHRWQPVGVITLDKVDRQQTLGAWLPERVIAALCECGKTAMFALPNWVDDLDERHPRHDFAHSNVRSA